MAGNGRFGGAIVWSIDTDDFNNAMPHHWVIACYLESNYYLSKTPMCSCRFWQTWAAKNLPGAPADIDSKFRVCDKEPCDADDPMDCNGSNKDKAICIARRRLHGENRKRRTTNSGSEFLGESNFVHHDRHTRRKQNKAATEEIQRMRVESHEREVGHYREHHLNRRLDFHAKHGRHLDTDRRHLTADSVTAPVHECTLNMNDYTIFPPPPFTDNCASDVTLPDTCPLKNGNVELSPPINITDENGNVVGQLPAQMKIMSSDVSIGNNRCHLKMERTWFFLDACYNMANKTQIYYQEDKTPPPLNVMQGTTVATQGTGADAGKTSYETTHAPAPAKSSCAEYINGNFNKKNENGTIGCPAAEVHYSCGIELPRSPTVNVSLDECSADLTNCPNGESVAPCLPTLSVIDGESTCTSWETPASASCPRLFSRSWETIDDCNNTRKFVQKVYVCASPPCNREDPAIVSCDGTAGGKSGAAGTVTIAGGDTCQSIADSKCPGQGSDFALILKDKNSQQAMTSAKCGSTFQPGQSLCYSCAADGTFGPTCKSTGEFTWGALNPYDSTNSVCFGMGNSAGTMDSSLIWKKKCTATDVTGWKDKSGTFCYNCAADGTWDSKCTAGSSDCAISKCSSLTSSSTPSLASVCTGGSYTGALIATASTTNCAGGVGGVACSSSDASVCCVSTAPANAKCSSLTSSSSPTLASVCTGGSYSGALKSGASGIECGGTACASSDAATCCAAAAAATSGLVTWQSGQGCYNRAVALCGEGKGNQFDSIFVKNINGATPLCHNPPSDPVVGQEYCYNCAADGNFAGVSGCIVSGGGGAAKAKCSSLTSSSSPTLASVCTGGSYSGALKSGASGQCCFGNPWAKTPTAGVCSCGESWEIANACRDSSRGLQPSGHPCYHAC